jgi:spermidine synthase
VQLREDPERLRVHVQDGVRFLEEAAAAAFDVVMLVDAPPASHCSIRSVTPSV